MKQRLLAAFITTYALLVAVSNANSHCESNFFDDYRTYDQILNFLHRLVAGVSEHAELLQLGSSFEGRPLVMLRIARDLEPKPLVIYMQAGLHAREWASITTLLYFAATVLQMGPEGVLNKVELQLVPVANPDGYEYSRTTYRLWRKNRQQDFSGSLLKHCVGIDLNRNYNIDFNNTISSSSFPCSDIYQGRAPFSASETRVLAEHLQTLAPRIVAFVDLHTFGRNLFYPFGYAKHTYYQRDQHEAVAQAMAAAIERTTGTRYTIGTAADTMYPSGGGGDDWVASVLQVPLVFTMELIGDSFEMNASQIVSLGAETSWGFLELIRMVDPLY